MRRFNIFVGLLKTPLKDEEENNPLILKAKQHLASIPFNLIALSAYEPCDNTTDAMIRAMDQELYAIDTPDMAWREMEDPLGSYPEEVEALDFIQRHTEEADGMKKFFLEKLHKCVETSARASRARSFNKVNILTTTNMVIPAMLTLMALRGVKLPPPAGTIIQFDFHVPKSGNIQLLNTLAI